MRFKLIFGRHWVPKDLQPLKAAFEQFRPEVFVSEGVLVSHDVLDSQITISNQAIERGRAGDKDQIVRQIKTQMPGFIGEIKAAEYGLVVDSSVKYKYLPESYTSQELTYFAEMAREYEGLEKAVLERIFSRGLVEGLTYFENMFRTYVTTLLKRRNERMVEGLEKLAAIMSAQDFDQTTPVVGFFGLNHRSIAEELQAQGHCTEVFYEDYGGTHLDVIRRMIADPGFTFSHVDLMKLLFFELGFGTTQDPHISHSEYVRKVERTYEQLGQAGFEKLITECPNHPIFGPLALKGTLRLRFEMS